MNNDKLIKFIAVLFVAILVLWMIYPLLFGTGMGYSMNFRGYLGGGHMNMNFGLGYGSTITYLLLLLVKVLFVVFVIALIGALVIWIKNNIFTEEDIDTIKKAFTGNNNKSKKTICSVCDNEMEPEWNVCPHCGIEKVKKGESEKDR